MLDFLAILNTEAERKAVQKLYETHKYRAVCAARRIVHDEALAEDAVHEAFVYLSEHYQELAARYPAGLEGYLFQCVRSRAVNLLRRRGREESYEALPETAAPGNARNVLAALEALPEPYALTLELYATGWRTEELAENLGLSPRTVQRRLKKARELLRKELGENDELSNEQQRIV